MKNLILAISLVFVSVFLFGQSEKADSVSITTVNDTINDIVKSESTYYYDNGEKWIHVEKENPKNIAIKKQRKGIKKCTKRIEIINREIVYMRAGIEKMKKEKRFLVIKRKEIRSNLVGDEEPIVKVDPTSIE